MNMSEVVESVDRAGITKTVAELRLIGDIRGSYSLVRGGIHGATKGYSVSG